MHRQMGNEKRAVPATFLCWRLLFTLPLYACMKQIFLMKEGIPLHIRFLKLVYSKGKIIVFKHKHVVEETKMLIKLIAVHSYHFIRCKCKIMHCSDSQTLSEYISRNIFDDNEKLSISEVLDVLISAGTFTSKSSFGAQRFLIVTVNELKKSIPCF